MKEARPEAVLYTTQANILFRTNLSRNGSAFSLNPTRDTILLTTDYVPKNAEYQIGEQTRFGWNFSLSATLAEITQKKQAKTFSARQSALALTAGISVWLN